MAKMTLAGLREHFGNYSTETKVDIMWTYIKYVEKFPETHDEGSYPVCFWEWYQNDLPNTDVVQF